VASLLSKLLNRTPVPFAPRMQVQMPWFQRSGATAQMAAMGSVGTLFAIVSRLANSTAQVEWKLYRKAASGKDEDRTEVTRHAALDLWNRPNPYMPQQEFVEAQQQHLELTGESWWVIARDPRSPLPLEMWPVRPDRMAPVPDPVDFVARYEYSGPNGEVIPLRRDEVIFLRTPNPLDPYRGMGPVQTIMADLDADRYTSEWNRNFFINSAEPGGIIEVDRRLDDTEFNELRDRWQESHQGVSNAHRVAILEMGKWVSNTFSQRDMQFVELRQVSSERIREAFGFPKPILGGVDDVNRANAEAAQYVYAKWLQVPRLERIKDALNFELLPMYGPEAARSLEFDYENPVPDDEAAENAELTARANAAVALVNVGFDPAAVLKAVDLPDMLYGGGPSPVAAPLPPGTQTPAVPPAPAAPVAARLDIHHHSGGDMSARSLSLFDLQRARKPFVNGHHVRDGAQ
jgi:HK97 family phage portal protein